MMRCLSEPVINKLPSNVKPVSFRVSRRFIAAHHYLGYAPPSHKFSLGVYAGCDLVGVMVFGRPIARLEDQDTTLELTRMCLFPAPKNSASRALSLAEKWIKTNRDERRLIAYSDLAQGHQGTIYKAANWRLMGEVRGESWKRQGRRRRGKIGGNKLKFERIIS